MTDMLKKFRGYYHFIKKQQKHREAFGVHPIRAVLVETTDEARGKKLMELAGHPQVAGPGKRAGLFWFSISPLFTDPAAGTLSPAASTSQSSFLSRFGCSPTTRCTHWAMRKTLIPGLRRRQRV